MRTTELCVIFNPKAGRGRGLRHLESLRQTLRGRAEFLPTDGPGHAEELAREAARAGFLTLGAAGGDGTLHEVANGLLRADRPGAALAVFPLGSANDYAHTLGLRPGWWLQADPGPGSPTRTVDVGLVRSPDGRQRYFVNGLGLGFNGAVNLEARRIRWLRGLALYTTALLKALCFRYACPPLTVTMDGRERRVPTVALTLAIGRREGNFVLAPNALLDDGLFDYLHAGPVARWELLRYLPAIVTGRLPTDHPKLWTGRCREVQLTSEVPLTLHIDGELFGPLEQAVYRLEVRVLPAALRVLTGGNGPANPVASAPGMLVARTPPESAS